MLNQGVTWRDDVIALPVGGACTHPVVEGVLGAGHATVVTAVRLRGHHAPRHRVEGPAEGGRRRAGGRHLAVDRGGAELHLLQRDGWVRDSAHVQLVPGCTDIWSRRRTSKAAGDIWIS